MTTKPVRTRVAATWDSSARSRLTDEQLRERALAKRSKRRARPITTPKKAGGKP